MSTQPDNRKSEIDNQQCPRWWLVTLTVSPDDQENVSAVLFDLGSTGIVTVDETPESISLGAYFNVDAPSSIVRRLESELLRIGRTDVMNTCAVSAVPDEDWMRKWKAGFEAVEIGERLIVAPSWKIPEQSRGRAVIQIDPGMAFGTGTHETTRLCLEAIERYWHGGSLLDVGTGTGILAIAAALLEPGSRVVAIDIDPQAVEVARENVSINDVLDHIELRTGQPRDLADRKFNVLVANLTAEVIIDLTADLARCTAPNGLMILSGILTVLMEDVQRSLLAYGFTVKDHREAGEWSALVAVRAKMANR